MGFDKFEVGLGEIRDFQKSRHSRRRKSKISKEDDVGIQEASSTSESSQTIMYRSPKEAREEFHGEKADKSNDPMLRSSLNLRGQKKLNRSITWADEKVEHRMNGYDIFGGIHKPFLKPSAENEVEFLAMELRQAAEAVASGESDVNGAGPFLNNAPSLCRAPFEPKGTLSSISAILSVILGVHFGHVLIHMKDHSARLNHWIPTGCALLALGIVLHLSHVLDGSQITAERYELTKDRILPLGRAPEFSAQSGA
ncbi:hypothetical protein ACFX2I_010330 [Malus domestica]